MAFLDGLVRVVAVDGSVWWTRPQHAVATAAAGLPAAVVAAKGPMWFRPWVTPAMPPPPPPMGDGQ